jgi:hypothetical protein
MCICINSRLSKPSVLAHSCLSTGEASLAPVGVLHGTIAPVLVSLRSAGEASYLLLLAEASLYTIVAITIRALGLSPKPEIPREACTNKV